MDRFRYFYAYDYDIPPGLGVQNFSATHLKWLSITLVVLGVAVAAYTRMSETAKRKATRACVIALVVLEAARTVWALSIGHYVLSRMLPIHLCGIMIGVEFIGAFSGKRFFKEFAYCAGMPGALMALVTPEPSGYPLLSFQYLLSIVSHSLLVLVPLLWLVGDGFKPHFRSIPKSFAFLCGLAGFDALINTVLHSNYMFISKAPADTPIELFDKWVGHPGYVGLLLICVLIVWTLMYLPWYAAGRTRKPAAFPKGVGM